MAALLFCVYVLLKCGQLAGLALFKEKCVAVCVCSLAVTFLGHRVLFFLQIAGKGRKGWGRKVSLFLLLYFSIVFMLWICFCLCVCKNRSQIRPRTKCAHFIPVCRSFCGSVRSLIRILASWFCINGGLILEQFLLLSIVLCLTPQGFIHVKRTVVTLIMMDFVALCNNFDLLNVCMESLLNWIFYYGFCYGFCNGLSFLANIIFI